MPPTYAVVTFGCRVNTADSLALEAALVQAGASPGRADVADVVIVNSCAVTASAEQGTRQAIRRLVRTNPGARVLVTGCYATRRPDELALLEGVLQVVPNEGKARLDTIARSVLGIAPPLPATGDGPCGAAIAPGLAGRTAWTLAVQTGCDERCTYCVIPSTRGPGRSALPGVVQQQVRHAAARGFREVVLAGVHLGSYGRDLQPALSLVDLLGGLAPLARALGVRLRISSLEPMDVTGGLVDLVAEAGVFAPHFHLPLQHASDRVLSAMGRPYTLEHYARVVDRVRATLPEAAIGADVMVGFPGEDESDVDTLCRYLARSPLTSLHVFPYSDRPGTPAATLSGKVHGACTRDRATRVRAIGAALSDRFRAGQVGTEHVALTLEDGTLALTGNYCKVRIPPGHARNEWVRVRILAAGADSMAGEILA